MKGLDVTIIKLSGLVVDNDPFRLDSEFHRKECRVAIEAVRASGAEQFVNSSPEIMHPHEIVREYVEDNGVWFFRAQNIRPPIIDETNKVFVSQKDAAVLKQNRLKYGDVLITRTGANRGDCAYFDSNEEALASSHTFIVRSNQWHHAFLAAFFNSSYGKLQIDKGVYGAAQPEVAPYYLRRIWIPKVTKGFQQTLADVFSIAGKERRKTLVLAKQVEGVLFTALGLGNWQPPEPLTYTRRASDVSSVGRFDAEHFQPKYDAAVTEAKKRGAIIVTLQEIVWPLIAGIDSREFVEHGAPYIRVGDVEGGRIAKESAEKVPVSVAETVKDIQLRPGDVAYTRKGSFGNAAIARSGDEVCVISTEIIRLRINDEWKSKLLPEYLAAYINSELGRWQSEKWAHGAAFYSVSQDDLLKFVVLIPSFSEQLIIKDAIDKIEAARQRAQALLAAAQRAVEIAIEDSEPAALAYLKTQDA